MDSEVLTLLLTARYVGSPAFNALGKDIDALAGKSSSLAKTGAALDAIGVALTAAGIAGAAVIGEAVKQAAQYQQSLQRLVAIHAVLPSQMAAVDAAISHSSDLYGQHAQDWADASYFIVSAMAAQNEAVSAGAKNLSIYTQVQQDMAAYVAASGQGLPGSITPIQAASDIPRQAAAWGMKPQQWALVEAWNTAIERQNNITPAQLLQMTLNAAPGAVEAGVPMPQLLAIEGALATRGDYKARGGTEMKSGLSHLFSKAGQREARALGLNLNSYYHNGQFDLLGFTAASQQKMQGMSPVQRTNAMNALFGQVGNRAFGLLARPGALAMAQQNLLAEKNNPLGAMLQQAADQMHSPLAQLRSIFSSLSDILRLVGGAILNKLYTPLQRIAHFLLGLADKLHANPALAGKLAAGLVGGTAAALTGGPFLSIAGKLLMRYAKAHPKAGLGEFAGKGLSRVWGFGQKFSPLHLLPAVGKGFMTAPGAVLSGIKGIPGAVFGVLKGIGPALAGAVPAILSFGSALLPILAVVLLVVGGIAALVLIFLRYRKQAEGVVASIGKGLMPIFKAFAGLVKSTLGMIGKTWDSHKKQVDTAIKGLLAAFKSALPFFQVVGTIIAVVLGVVVRVVGYLVSAFLDALPHIIDFFSSVFRVLGDLGRIVMDVIHGNWGQAWKDAQAALAHAWGGIQALLRTLWSFIAGVLGRLWADIGPTVTRLWNGFIAALPGIWAALQRFFQSLPGRIGDLLDKLHEVSLKIWQKIIAATPKVLSALWDRVLLPFFQSLPGRVHTELLALQKRWERFWKETGPKIQPALAELWKKHLLPFFQSLPGKIWNLLVLIWGKMQTFWKSVGPKVAPFLAQLWNNYLWPFFKSLPQKIFQLLLFLIPKMLDFIRLLGRALDAILGWLWANVFLPFFKSLPGKIIGAIQSLNTLMFNFFKTLGQKAVEGIKQGMAGLGAAVKAATASIPVVGGAAQLMFGGHKGRNASGGYIPRAMLSWVGETGKELVALPGGSRVFSHADSMNMVNTALRPADGGGYHRGRNGTADTHMIRAGLDSLSTAVAALARAQGQRTPAEEYLFARNIQRERAAVWERYPNSSRDFDNTYRRAYQYYG